MLPAYGVPIHVKVLNGKTFNIDVQPSDLVNTLKEKIKTKTKGQFPDREGYKNGIPIQDQRLVANGQTLSNDAQSLSQFTLMHSICDCQLPTWGDEAYDQRFSKKEVQSDSEGRCQRRASQADDYDRNTGDESLY